MLRSGPGQVVCPGQSGWPVDRTALAVGSRNPPRRLRMERSTRSVVGISGLQAGEDVKRYDYGVSHLDLETPLG